MSFSKSGRDLQRTSPGASSPLVSTSQNAVKSSISGAAVVGPFTGCAFVTANGSSMARTWIETPSTGVGRI